MKQVVFDFGGVLVDWNPQKIVQTFTNDKALQEKLQREVFQHQDWLDLDKGIRTEQEAADIIATRVQLTNYEVMEVFNVVRATLTPIEKTVLLLKELVAHGIRCYGLTNMSVENYQYLRSTYDFFDLFSDIVVSGYEKCIKPDKKIFELLCERCNLQEQQTLFIDDSIANIEMAQSMGIDVCHFKNSASCIEQIKTNLTF